MKHRRTFTALSTAIFSLLLLAGPVQAQADFGALNAVEGTYRVPTQGQLHADVDQGAVRLRATGQEAIDWLVGADDKVQTQHRRLNHLAVRIVSEMVAGEDAVRREMLPNPASSSDIARLFAVYTEALGAPTHFEVVGTAPRADGSRQSYVRMVFAEQTMYLRLSWHGQALNTITRSAAPTFEATCAPAPAALTCTMHDDQTIALRRDDLGQVTQLVQSGRGTPVAYRTLTTAAARQ